jgi:hypothetical protein
LITDKPTKIEPTIINIKLFLLISYPLNCLTEKLSFNLQQVLFTGRIAKQGNKANINKYGIYQHENKIK